MSKSELERLAVQKQRDMQLSAVPGPWHIKTSASGNYFVYDNAACRSTDYVAGVSSVKPDRDTARANAVLIAAAPDLLAALQMFMAQYYIEGDADREARPEIRAALAAVKKATKGGAW